MAELLAADLIRAAEILEREAKILFHSYTTRVGTRLLWHGFAPKDDHDEMRRLARRFRKVAGTL